MRLSKRKLVFKMTLWLVISAGFLQAAGCASPAAPPPQSTEMPLLPTLIEIPTLRPTYTSAVFELRPTGTPLPVATSPHITQPVAVGPGSYESDVNPLTGLHVADPSRLERRPAVIKITNFPRSVRPQWGLTVADHVYEYYLEDEMTRFIAVFYGNDAERVGPIRSGRPFDEHIVRAYKGIFVFAYADDRLIDLWTDSDLNPFLVIERPGSCPPMCRIGSKDNYNTLFTNTQQLTDYVAGRAFSHGRQDLSGLRFELNPSSGVGGSPARRLEVRYSPTSYNYWDYNPATYRYYRWEDTERMPAGEELYEPLFDSLTAQQVYADNLVVLLVPTAYFFKSNSTEVYDIQFIGSGQGFALREGNATPINWRRPQKESMLQLAYPNGRPYPLKPGNVFFEVLTSVSPHIITDMTWFFEFNLPEDMPVPTKTPKKGSP